jgi:hypothetical protein
MEETLIVMSMMLAERSDNVQSNASEGVELNAKKMLNRYQQEHLEGKRNVYKPVEAYKEDWIHEDDKHGNFIKAYPKPGTRRRQDLPSLSEQWREDAKARSLK